MDLAKKCGTSFFLAAGAGGAVRSRMCAETAQAYIYCFLSSRIRGITKNNPAGPFVARCLIPGLPLSSAAGLLHLSSKMWGLACHATPADWAASAAAGIRDSPMRLLLYLFLTGSSILHGRSHMKITEDRKSLQIQIARTTRTPPLMHNAGPTHPLILVITLWAPLEAATRATTRRAHFSLTRPQTAAAAIPPGRTRPRRREDGAWRRRRWRMMGPMARMTRLADRMAAARAAAGVVVRPRLPCNQAETLPRQLQPLLQLRPPPLRPRQQRARLWGRLFPL